MIDPTAKTREVTLNAFRMRTFRLVHGATDADSNDSVPKNRREKFREHVQFHVEDRGQWFERACRYYGATDGTWATVPEENHADALRFIGRRNLRFLNRSELEYDLLVIAMAEEAAADMDFG